MNPEAAGVLVVDDEFSVRDSLEQWFKKDRLWVRLGQQQLIQILDFFRYADVRSSFSGAALGFPVASSQRSTKTGPRLGRAGSSLTTRFPWSLRTTIAKPIVRGIAMIATTNTSPRVRSITVSTG